MVGEHSYIKFVPGLYVVYLSVPKVASSSISYTMMLHAATGDPLIAEHSALGKTLTNRRAITQPYPKLPVFTFVRHPIDKFISYYRDKFYRVRNTGFDLVDLPKLGFDPQMSVDEAVAHMMTIPVGKMEHHAQPQSRILVRHGKLLADYVGKFETIQDEWKYIAKLSLANFDLQYPRNSTEKNQEFSVSDASVGALFRYYETDFLLFDYEKPEKMNSNLAIPEDSLLELDTIEKIKCEMWQRKRKWIETCKKLESSNFLDNYRKEMKGNFNQYLLENYRFS